MSIKNYINYNFAFIFLIFISCTIFIKLSNQNIKKSYFVLLTDFGYDFAVGSIKGVISSQLPNTTIIDLDHSIEKFNIISGGFVLAKAYKYFPQGTIFICVVDPGVGTKREPICIKTPFYTFIGPNNGLFDFVLKEEIHRIVYEIDESYLKPGANTFHGRDLFAPAAVDFYKNNLEKFKIIDESKLIHIIKLDQTIAAYIDSYGNIKTNKEIISDIKFGTIIILEINGHSYKVPFVKTFKDVPNYQALSYKGSNGTLEIAVNQGSAAKEFDVKVGDTIILNI